MARAELGESVGPSTDLRNVPGADSVKMLRMVARIEREYDLELEDEDAKIHANLFKLAPADRKIAEAQEFCVVLKNNRLGSMGIPVKVMLEGQAVFLCCSGCRSQALRVRCRRSCVEAERMDHPLRQRACPRQLGQQPDVVLGPGRIDAPATAGRGRQAAAGGRETIAGGRETLAGP